MSPVEKISYNIIVILLFFLWVKDYDSLPIKLVCLAR